MRSRRRFSRHDRIFFHIDDKRVYATCRLRRVFAQEIQSVATEIATMIYGTILGRSRYYKSLSRSAKKGIDRQLRKIARKERQNEPKTHEQLRITIRAIGHQDRLAYALRWFARYDPIYILSDEGLAYLNSLRPITISLLNPDAPTVWLG